METERRVAVVVGPEHVGKARELVAECPVWVIRTRESERIANETWGDDTDNLTLFNGSADIQATLLDVLPEIELHHGEATGEPPISRIDVLGGEPSETVRRVFGSMGLPHLVPSAVGFVALAEAR